MARQQKKHRAAPAAAAAPTGATCTIEQAARRLKIGRNQCYSAAHNGQLPVIKIGKRLLVPTAALARLLGEVA